MKATVGLTVKTQKLFWRMVGALLVSMVLCASCGIDMKFAKRLQLLEAGVGSPTTIEEFQDAIKLYGRRVESVTSDQAQIGIWYKLLGTRYLDQEMYGEALKAFEKAVEYYPANQNLYYYVGVSAGYVAHNSLDFSATGDTAKKHKYLKLSESAYARAIQIDPHYVRALYGLSILYVFEFEEPATAIPYLDTLLSVDKKNIEAMFLLARAYYSIYDFEHAIEVYDKIIAVSSMPQEKALAAEHKKTVMDFEFAGNAASR